MAQVGRSIPRIEARHKVTGSAEYTQHLRLPGMLHGKIFRSTIAHGRIRNIDARAARRMTGVHCVITIEDILKLIPDPYYGPAFHDQPILAHEKVRHIGEPVAVVLLEEPGDQVRRRVIVEIRRGDELGGPCPRQAQAGSDIRRSQASC